MDKVFNLILISALLQTKVVSNEAATYQY